MKKLFLFSLMATLSFSQLTKAEDIIIPVISKPAVLEEGTQRVLTKEQIDLLIPWAKNSVSSLKDIVARVEGLNDSERLELLVEEVERIVGESAPKKSEMLMRYVLNRALVINKILEQETKQDIAGTIDAKLRVMYSSIQMAINYSSVDIDRLAGKGQNTMALFGIDYFDFLTELNKSIYDVSAQYAIEKTSFEWLQWDLYREVDNKPFASQIVKINGMLNTLPKFKPTDAEALIKIRQLKRLEVQLNIADWIKTIPGATQAQISGAQKEPVIVVKKQNEKSFAEDVRERKYRKQFTGEFQYVEDHANSNMDLVEYTINVPVAMTGNPDNPINWDVTFALIKANSRIGVIDVKGQKVQILSSDASRQAITIGFQGRTYLIKDYIEGVVKAEYATRSEDRTTEYYKKTGNVFDPIGGVSVSAGLNYTPPTWRLTGNLLVGQFLESKETFVNIGISLRID